MDDGSKVNNSMTNEELFVSHLLLKQSMLFLKGTTVTQKGCPCQSGNAEFNSFVYFNIHITIFRYISSARPEEIWLPGTYLLLITWAQAENH